MLNDTYKNIQYVRTTSSCLAYQLNGRRLSTTIKKITKVASLQEGICNLLKDSANKYTWQDVSECRERKPRQPFLFLVSVDPFKVKFLQERGCLLLASIAHVS